MKNKIIYIDDEINSEKMSSKIEIIEDITKLKVIKVDSVDSAMDVVINKANDTVVILLDIIMPLGNIYNIKDTSGGTLTGIRLLKDIRSKYPSIPIIIISIRKIENFENFEGTMSEFSVTKFFEKQSVTSTAIGNFIKNLI